MGTVENDAHRFAPAAPQEDAVYGACSPGWHSAGTHSEAVAQWVETMKGHGIDRVCCLLSGTLSEECDGQLGQYHEAFGRENVIHVPLSDHHLIDIEVVRTEVLPFLRETVERDQRVVVHGLAGLGRTGQVLAAWLVSEYDYRPHEALDTVREMGRVPTEAVDEGKGSRLELLDRLSQLR